jgi:hypothetical protein
MEQLGAEAESLSVSSCLAAAPLRDHARDLSRPNVAVILRWDAGLDPAPLPSHASTQAVNIPSRPGRRLSPVRFPTRAWRGATILPRERGAIAAAGGAGPRRRAERGTDPRLGGLCARQREGRCFQLSLTPALSLSALPPHPLPSPPIPFPASSARISCRRHALHLCLPPSCNSWR